MPPRLRGGAWGPRVTFRRGVSIPPNHLIRNTQRASIKFPTGMYVVRPCEMGKGYPTGGSFLGGDCRLYPVLPIVKNSA